MYEAGRCGFNALDAEGCEIESQAEDELCY